MDDDDRDRLIAKRVSRWERLYQASGNPFCVWRAYDLSRSGGAAIPRWVLQYFDRVAEMLELGPPPRKGTIAPRLVKAMGFAPGGVEVERLSSIPDPMRTRASLREKPGRYNPFQAMARDERDLFLVEAVAVSEQAGASRMEAIRTVASAEHVTIRKVQRALQRLSTDDTK